MVVFCELFIWVCNVDECIQIYFRLVFLLSVGKEESLENLPIIKER